MSYQGFEQGQAPPAAPPGAVPMQQQQQEGMQAQPGMDGSQPPFQAGASAAEGAPAGGQGSGDMKTTLWYVLQYSTVLLRFGNASSYLSRYAASEVLR